MFIVSFRHFHYLLIATNELLPLLAKIYDRIMKLSLLLNHWHINSNQLIPYSIHTFRFLFLIHLYVSVEVDSEDKRWIAILVSVWFSIVVLPIIISYNSRFLNHPNSQSQLIVSFTNLLFSVVYRHHSEMRLSHSIKKRISLYIVEMTDHSIFKILEKYV